MIKKCKQCGCTLTPDENNKLCKNCREKKKSQQQEVRDSIVSKKMNKTWKSFKQGQKV